jgi:hypothetical protein
MSDDSNDMNDPEAVYAEVRDDKLADALSEIESCFACNPDADIPFHAVLRAFNESLANADIYS